MGMLMIRCPKTGQAIFTGRYVESATFLSTPVFFSRTHCPLRQATHEWFAKEAWVCDFLGAWNLKRCVSFKLPSWPQPPGSGRAARRYFELVP